jgi:hypothetical protein
MQGPEKRPADVSLRKKVVGRFIVFIVGIVTQRADTIAERRVPSVRLWIVGCRVLSFPGTWTPRTPIRSVARSCRTVQVCIRFSLMPCLRWLGHRSSLQPTLHIIISDLNQPRIKPRLPPEPALTTRHCHHLTHHALYRLSNGVSLVPERSAENVTRHHFFRLIVPRRYF